jgi:hypothetical protein
VHEAAVVGGRSLLSDHLHGAQIGSFWRGRSARSCTLCL